MIQYTSLKAGLRLIPSALFEQNNESDFLSWMLDALRDANLASVFHENHVEIFEFKNNRLVLPQDIKEINLITYLAHEPSKTDLTSFQSCICNPESNATSEDTNSPCKYTLAYRLFLNSAYYNNNYAPLQYKGTYSNSLLCSDCPNRFTSCNNTFTITTSGVLNTNLNCGYLCIDYSREARDENGDYLIPDDTTLKQYLAYYAIAKQWQNRAASKEQGASREAQDYLILAETYLKRVKGSAILNNIDPAAIAAAMGDSYMRFIKIPERYVYSR